MCNGQCNYAYSGYIIGSNVYCCLRKDGVYRVATDCTVLECKERWTINEAENRCDCVQIENAVTYDNYCQVASCVEPNLQTISVNKDACCPNVPMAAAYNTQCEVVSCSDPGSQTISEGKDACCPNVPMAAAYNAQCEVVSCSDRLDFSASSVMESST